MGSSTWRLLTVDRQEKKDFKDEIKAHMLNLDEENYKKPLMPHLSLCVWGN